MTAPDDPTMTTRVPDEPTSTRSDGDSDDAFQRALDHALQFLAFRARSVEEVRARLRRYGYDPELTSTIIQRLLDLGYLDDATFALLLARDYLAAPRPKGEYAILARLRELGVPETTARTALSQALEDAAETPHDRVRRAAERWCRRLRPGYDHARATQRLYNHLARAGFDRTLIRTAIEEVLPSA